MYRDVLPVAKSFYRLSMVFPALRLGYLLGYFSGQTAKAFVDSVGVGVLDAADFCVRLDNDMMVGVFIFAVITSVYLDARQRGFDVSALRYEDLVARPLDMCRAILEFCRLPVTLAEPAVKAFDVDSQENTMLKKSVIGRFTEPQLTPQKKAKLNELLLKFGLPLIGEPCVVEGTLFCSQ